MLCAFISRRCNLRHACRSNDKKNDFQACSLQKCEQKCFAPSIFADGICVTHIGQTIDDVQAHSLQKMQKKSSSRAISSAATESMRQQSHPSLQRDSPLKNVSIQSPSSSVAEYKTGGLKIFFTSFIFIAFNSYVKFVFLPHMSDAKMFVNGVVKLWRMQYIRHG